MWGDHVFVTAAVNTKGAEEPLKPVPSYAGRSVGGPMSGRDIGSSTDSYRWVVYDVDFKTGKIRWQSRSTRRAGRAEAPEEQLRVGDAGDRRRARVRVLRQRRPVRVRHERQACLVEADGAVQDAHRLGHRPRRRSSTRIASTSSTTTTISRSSRPTTRGPARRSGASSATRAATGRRRSSGRTSSAPRSSRPAPTRCAPTISTASCSGTLTGMSTIHPDAARRHGLLYISSGYPGDPLRPVYAIRPGASGDISLKPGETSNASIAWSHPTLGAYNRRRSSTATTTTR